MAWHVADGTKHDKPLHEHSHHHPCWTDTCTTFPCEPVQTGHPLPQQHKVTQPGLLTPTTGHECVPIFDIRATAGYWNLDDLRDEDFPDFQVYSDAPLHGLKRFLVCTKPKGDKRQKSLTWNYVEFRILRWRLDRFNELLDKERERAALAKERVGELERSIVILRWRLERRIEIFKEEDLRERAR